MNSFKFRNRPKLYMQFISTTNEIKPCTQNQVYFICIFMYRAFDVDVSWTEIVKFTNKCSVSVWKDNSFHCKPLDTGDTRPRVNYVLT